MATDDNSDDCKNDKSKSNGRSPRPRLDLATIRETLIYMHGDLAATHGLARAAAAMQAAILEIDAAIKRPRVLPGASYTGLRLLPRKH